MAKLKAGKRNLRREGVEVTDWRAPVDGRAPRLGPGEFIGTGITRRGRFASTDPLRTGNVWTRWHVLGLVFWLGWVASFLGLAKRRVDRTG